MQIRRERLVKEPLSSGLGVDLHSAPLKNIPMTGLSQLERKWNSKTVLLVSGSLSSSLVFWGYCKPGREWAPKPSIPTYCTLKFNMLL